MKTVGILLACASIALPFAAFAQSADTKYCDALSAAYRTSGVSKGDSPEAVAMAKCKTDPASSIPVLEKSLKDNKVALPPRG
jgi:hypothetical protein